MSGRVYIDSNGAMYPNFIITQLNPISGVFETFAEIKSTAEDGRVRIYHRVIANEMEHAKPVSSIYYVDRRRFRLLFATVWPLSCLLLYLRMPKHVILNFLLLLAAPTWLWGSCGRHNCPPVSSVMDLVFRRSDGSRVSVDTVHPSLLRSSSLSSSG